MIHLTGVTRLSRSDMECVDQAIAYLYKNYTESVSAEQLSVEVALNVKKLQAGFRKKTGLTVHHHLLKIRIDHAKDDLMNLQLSVKAITAKNGFKDVSQFGKIFKKHTGQTPMEYRHELTDYKESPISC